MAHAHAVPSPKRSESPEPSTTTETRRRRTARSARPRATPPTLKDAQTIAAYLEANEDHQRRASSRHAVWLCHGVQRLSLRATAAALGLSEETVAVHLRRLRLAARSWWDSERTRGGKAPALAAGSSSPVG